MFDWFKSRYTRSLELRIEELKTTHAKELECVKTELAWHKEETERLRRFLMPTMQPVYERVRALNEPETPEPAEKEPQFHGTPFQRLIQQDLAQQDAEIAARQAQQKREAEDKAKAAENAVH